MSSDEFLAYMSHTSRLVILVTDPTTNRVQNCLWKCADLEVDMDRVGKKSAITSDKIQVFDEVKEFIIEKVHANLLIALYADTCC